MEQTKIDKILANQEILNHKLNMILKMLHDNQYSNNCQIFLQGLSLVDIMNGDLQK